MNEIMYINNKEKKLNSNLGDKKENELYFKLIKRLLVLNETDSKFELPNNWIIDELNNEMNNNPIFWLSKIAKIIAMDAKNIINGETEISKWKKLINVIDLPVKLKVMKYENKIENKLKIDAKINIKIIILLCDKNEFDIKVL